MGSTGSEPSARLPPTGGTEAPPDGAALAVDPIELRVLSLQLAPATAERHGHTQVDLPRPPQGGSSPNPWLAMLALPAALAPEAHLVPRDVPTRPFRWPKC